MGQRKYGLTLHVMWSTPRIRFSVTSASPKAEEVKLQGPTGTLSRCVDADPFAMIEGQHPVLQALLGSLFTWGLTALVRPLLSSHPVVLGNASYY